MAHAHDHGHEQKPNGAGYEVEDASIREVVLTGIGLAIGTIIVCVAVYGLFKVLGAVEVRSRQPITMVPQSAQYPPEPRLQQHPWEEFQAIRSHETQVLSNYTWVDKNAGKVRMPIDRAMEMVLQRGLPVRAAGDQSGTGTPKTGREARNVPDQATGVPNNASRK